MYPIFCGSFDCRFSELSLKVTSITILLCYRSAINDPNLSYIQHISCIWSLHTCTDGYYSWLSLKILASIEYSSTHEYLWIWQVLVRYILIEYKYGFEHPHEYSYLWVNNRSIPWARIFANIHEYSWIYKYSVFTSIHAQNKYKYSRILDTHKYRISQRELPIFWLNILTIKIKNILNLPK